MIPDSDALESVEDAWEHLAGARGPTQHFLWAKVFGEVFAHDYQLSVVTCGDQRRPSAIAPLAFRRRRLSRLEFLGMSQFHEPMDLLYEDTAALESLAEALVRTGRPVALQRMPADSPAVGALSRAYKPRAVIVSHPAAACPWIALDESWCEPEGKFDRDRRSDVRRARRRAEKVGPVAAEILSPSAEELPSLLDEAFRVEAANWKGREGTALACDPVRGEFFRRYCDQAARVGLLRISVLRIREKAAAVQIAAESSNRFWLLKVGFDEEFARCSPGTLLLVDVVRHAAERGLEALELLGTVEPWTRMWTDRVHEHVSFRAYPTLRSGAFVLSDAAAYLRGLPHGNGDGHGRGHGHAGDSDPVAGARRRLRRAIWRALARRAASAYVVGGGLEGGLAACERLAERGYSTALGYWNDDEEPAQRVLDVNLEAMRSIAARGLDCYMSVKLAAVGLDASSARRLADGSAATGVGLHFDSLGPETAAETLDAVAGIAGRCDWIGCTLPGRWRRSISDADRVADLGLRVRVTKGQWDDLDGPVADARAGFIAVVDRLAGRARHVSVATHDPVVAEEALRLLARSGTPHDMEVLAGLPAKAVVPLAKVHDVPVRVYVAFGHGSLPYSPRRARENPRLLLWVLGAMIKGRRVRPAEKLPDLRSDRC